MGKFSDLSDDVVKSGVLAKVLLDSDGYKTFGRLCCTCSYFKWSMLSDSHLKSINLRKAPLFGSNSLSSYRSFIERCAGAENVEALYIAGVSHSFLSETTEFDHGVSNLNEAYNSCKSLQYLESRRVEYALWLLLMPHLSGCEAASVIFTSLYTTFGFNLSNECRELVDKLRVHPIKRSSMSAMKCPCNSGRCRSLCTAVVEREYWDNFFCCMECCAIREYMCFARSLRLVSFEQAN